MINFWAQAKWVIQNKGTAVFTKSVRIISKQIFNYLKKKINLLTTKFRGCSGKRAQTSPSLDPSRDPDLSPRLAPLLPSRSKLLLMFPTGFQADFLSEQLLHTSSLLPCSFAPTSPDWRGW